MDSGRGLFPFYIKTHIINFNKQIMPKNTHTEFPLGYPVCQFADCPVASSCLHNLAYAPLKQKETYLRLINPDKCAKSETCTFYRSDKPITYARGFTNFQKRMFPEQYQHFMSICVKRFGRNPYYERRRGDYGIPPSEQNFILDALKQSGVTEEMQFDGYSLQINWYD